jgi:hypothetical protein
LKLIQSISIQLLAPHGQTDALKSLMTILPSQDYKTAVQSFQKLISEYPVHLYIDSLDQLENCYEARSKLTFLRDIRPHAQSRIIVSTLPDEYDENGLPGKYFCQCEKTLKTGSVPIVDVGVMDKLETTMESLLKFRHKKITNDQWILDHGIIRSEYGMETMENY